MRYSTRAPVYLYLLVSFAIVGAIAVLTDSFDLSQNTARQALGDVLTVGSPIAAVQVLALSLLPDSSRAMQLEFQSKRNAIGASFIAMSVTLVLAIVARLSIGPSSWQEAAPLVRAAIVLAFWLMIFSVLILLPAVLTAKETTSDIEQKELHG